MLVYTKACSIKNQHNLKRDFNYTQVPQQGSACLHHRNSTYCSVVFMTFNFMWLIFMWVCFWRCCLFCFLVDKLGGGNLLKPLFTNLSKYGLEGDLYPPLLPRENNYLLTEHFLWWQCQWNTVYQPVNLSPSRNHQVINNLVQNEVV